jgi:phosphatidate cytidylyltransferase
MTDTPEPGAPAPKAGSDLTVRFASGVAMIAVAVLVTIMGGWAFRGFVLLAVAAMLVEWADMRKVPRLWAYVGTALAAAVLLGAAEYFYPADYGDVTLLSFAPVLGGAILLGLASRRPAMAWGFLYIVLPAFCLIILSWAAAATPNGDTINGDLVFWVFAVTWSTDIFAYFAGRAIGGPKLAPRISPNKTWAGLLGGMIGASFFGWAVAWYFALGTPFLWLGATMGLVAQLGDLYESWEKRRAGIKDSGSIIPGHGGVLDRLDGLLAVAAVTVAILMVIELRSPPTPDDDGAAEMGSAIQLTAEQAG